MCSTHTNEDKAAICHTFFVGVHAHTFVVRVIIAGCVDNDVHAHTSHMHLWEDTVSGRSNYRPHNATQ